MVISRSENIYLAEIEKYIHEMIDITDGVVVVKPDDKWSEVPVTVAITKYGIDLSEAEFLGRFKGQLARYKHPKAVFFVEELPRNTMGKILKYEVRKFVDN